MNKQLLTSAIALGAFAAAPASAQEWNLDWGGFLSANIAIVDTSNNFTNFEDPAQPRDLDGVRTFNTGEIQFTPSITLDNGLTFGANVQFEAQNSPNFNITNNDELLGGGNNIVDETYVEVSSDTFGRLVVGAENSAGYLLSTGAPNVGGFFVNSPSFSAFLPVSGNFSLLRAPGSSSFSEVQRNNDIQRITYFTPNFNGLTIGASYAPNNNGNGEANNGFAVNSVIVADSNEATLEDIWDVGLNYSQSFDSFGVRFSARYGEGDGVGGAVDSDLWQVGASFDFGAFTVGGSYGEADGIDSSGTDQDGWSFGVAYDAPGPWTFGAETVQGTQDNSDGVNTSDLQVYKAAASRQIGPGVSWDIFFVYVEATDELDSSGDLDGGFLGTSINLSF